MIYTSQTVVGIARQAEEYTAGAVRLARAAKTADGLCYVDHHRKSLVWDSRRSRTAAREAAAYYAGAARQWATLTGQSPVESMPPLLHEALRDLASARHPVVVHDSYRRGSERVLAVWPGTRQAALIRARRARRAVDNPGTALVGERRTLRLDNRDELIAWSGGREPADPGSDVLLIDRTDGSTLVVVNGQTVERTPDGYRRVPTAEVRARRRPSNPPFEVRPPTAR